MKNLLIVIVLFVAGIAGLGFYRGWFSLSTDNVDNKPSATITMDKDKIQDDEQIAKDKMHNFGQGAKEKTGELADKVKEQTRRP